MIARRKLPAVKAALARQAAVALIGPRQVGKTTLALNLAEEVPSLYLDLEANTRTGQSYWMRFTGCRNCSARYAAL